MQRIYPETIKLSFKSNNLYQITSANNINSKRLYKNKYENSLINIYGSTIGSKTWDIVRVLKFKVKKHEIVDNKIRQKLY